MSRPTPGSPDWARKTLAEHASDPREAIYGLDDFEFARTHDPLWNGPYSGRSAT